MAKLRLKAQAAIFERAHRFPICARLISDRKYRTLAKAVACLAVNMIYAIYNGILGIISSSALFSVSALYYLLLAAMRFSGVVHAGKARAENENHAIAFIGIMLTVQSAVFAIVAAIETGGRVAEAYGTVTMITIATFTFSKIIAASISRYRNRSVSSRLLRTISAVRYAEIAVSLLAMQRSMLASFGDGDAPHALILNALTGAGVCGFILILGVLTLRQSR